MNKSFVFFRNVYACQYAIWYIFTCHFNIRKNKLLVYSANIFSRVSLLDVAFCLLCFAFTHTYICERLFLLFLTKANLEFIPIWTGFKTSVLKLHLIRCCKHNICLWVSKMINTTKRRQTFNTTCAMLLSAWNYLFICEGGYFLFNFIPVPKKKYVVYSKTRL